MSRWIDADAVKIRYRGGFHDDYVIDYDSFVNAPSIDIVRCKECKRHGRDDCPMWEGAITEDYMFCSCGERKK